VKVNAHIMKTIPQARNITVNCFFTPFSGKEQRFSTDLYLMAPESKDIWSEYNAYNSGNPATLQAIVNLAYWYFLNQQGADIEAHLLPSIPFKFNRKTNDSVVTLQDGYSLRIWIDINTRE
jgi:hypothetical protein